MAKKASIAFPQITQAQVVSAVTWVVAQVVALGWVDNNTGQILIQAAATLISIVWIAADAYLRGKRNQHAAAVMMANASGVQMKSIAAPAPHWDTANLKSM